MTNPFPNSVQNNIRALFVVLASLIFSAHSLAAEVDAPWDEQVRQAREQTVYFNAWGVTQLVFMHDLERLAEPPKSVGAGTIGNTHFVTIPYNAKAKQGATVVANFLISSEAQTHKESSKIWGLKFEAWPSWR